MSEQKIMLDRLLAILDENQAIDVEVIDVSKQTSVTDYMVVCGGRSSRQVKSLALIAMEAMKASGYVSLGNHGLDSGEWALVDFADIVLHVMQAETRAFYNIEGLWKEGAV